MSDFTQQLRESLQNRPDPLEIAEVALGVSSESDSLQAYLGDNPDTHPEIVMLRRFWEQLEPEPIVASVPQRPQLRVLLAQLLPTRAIRPAFAVRGTIAAPRTYVADEIRVMVSVREERTQQNRWRVVGMVSGMSPEAGDVTMLDESGSPANVVSLKGANFNVERVTAGKYDLLISTDEVEVVIEGIVIPV